MGDNYSPVDSDYWPGQNNYGWNTKDIEDYHNKLGDKVIEVRATHYSPYISKPFLEMNYNTEKK